MRHVLALFDAPVPARAALRALAAAGFAPDDLACVAASSVPETSALASARLPIEASALERRLRSYGLSSTAASTCAEGVVLRGAILVVATCPTLSAGGAQRALDGAAPPSLSEHRSRWEGRNGDALTRYGWADLPSPFG